MSRSRKSGLFTQNSSRRGIVHLFGWSSVPAHNADRPGVTSASNHNVVPQLPQKCVLTVLPLSVVKL